MTLYFKQVSNNCLFSSND